MNKLLLAFSVAILNFVIATSAHAGSDTDSLEKLLAELAKLPSFM